MPHVLKCVLKLQNVYLGTARSQMVCCEIDTTIKWRKYGDFLAVEGFSHTPLTIDLYVNGT